MYGCTKKVFDRLPVINIKFFLLVILLTLQLGAAGSVIPEDIETPVDVHIPIFFRILTFDRNFKNRVGEEIVIGIVYQERFRKSYNIKSQLESYLEGLPVKKIADVPFRYVSISLSSLSEFKTSLEKEKVDIVYFTPLRAVSIQSLVAVSRSPGITSFSGVSEYCDYGVAISVRSIGGNPSIIINLKAARSEGADFSSRLLKLAKVIEE